VGKKILAGAAAALVLTGGAVLATDHPGHSHDHQQSSR
jgi:hypothetical protein